MHLSIPLIPGLAAFCLQAADPVGRYDATEVEALRARADALGLHQDPLWLSLLHYATGIRGHRSRVDDPRFFLHPTGHVDPRAELHATLTALCLDAAPEPGQEDAPPSAAERFPARLEWLAETLALERERLPVPFCAELENVLATITMPTVTLVFPDAYLGTPASMFGHTLLVLGGAQTSPLLRQAINYGAIATDSNGLVYAFRGVFGRYRGRYTLEPFYVKAQQYIDLNQRDLWEYELALEPHEVQRMVRHVWELREIWSAYWFFDENCSYNLLFLLDVARPGLGLSDAAGLWVIPIDTVRAVADADLIRERRWRPSRASVVRQGQATLLAHEHDAVADLISGALAPEALGAAHPDRERQVRMLDLAIAQLRAQRGRQRIAIEPYRDQLHAVLAARARLGDTVASPPPIAPPAPETGHATTRVTLGGGGTETAHFAELRFRPAIHDLLDRPDGFLPGSQVVFAETTLRWYDDTQRLELEQLDVLSLRAFAHRDRFIRPLAWHLDLGMLQQSMGEQGRRRIHGRLAGGAGGAWKLGDALVHTTVTGDVRAGALTPHYAIGVGAAAGVYLPLGAFGVVHPYAEAMEYVAGDRTTRWDIGAELRLWTTRDSAIGGSIARRGGWDWQETVWSARVDVYF